MPQRYRALVERVREAEAELVPGSDRADRGGRALPTTS